MHCTFEMQRLEQEVRELHSGIAGLVQALSFLQTFLESDYGLKFQFHAYCNSPLFSSNSNVLEVLKQKYGSADYDRNTSVYHQSQATATNSGQQQIVHVRFQTPEPGQPLGSVNVISGCTVGHCTTQSTLEPTYVTVSAPGNLENHHQSSSSAGSITADLNESQREPIIVRDDEIHIFGISELTNMKGESHELYNNDNEIDAFGKQDFEENHSESNDEEIADTPSSELNSVSLNQAEENSSATVSSTPKRKKGKKDKGDLFKCPHCRRKCADRIKLELHMSHHKQQFQCSECGIWLADKSVLNRHMRSHTNERPFTCEFCKETFTRQDIVKKHISRKHKGMLENGNLASGITKFNKPSSSSNKS